MQNYQYYRYFGRLLCIIALLSSLAAPSASAKERRSYYQETVADTSTGDYYRSGGGHRWGLGFSAISYLTAPSGGLPSTGNTAVTGWLDLAPNLGLQPLITIEQTSPFSIIFGGLIKYTVARNGSAGFHLGGGVSMGSVAVPPTAGAGGAITDHAFAFALSGLAGFHFPVPGASNIMVHVDGGPVFTVVNGNSDFRLQSLSPLLGLSAIYLF